MKMPTRSHQARWMPRARRWLAASAMAAGLGMLGAQVLPRFARLTELRGKQADAARELAHAEAERELLEPGMQQGPSLPVLRWGEMRGSAAARRRGAGGSFPTDWKRSG